MSGTRNDPPISTNSPRDTMASPPAANSCSTRKTAAALLFTTTAGTPNSRWRSAEACASRLPRVPVPRSYSRLVYDDAASATACAAAADIGARPRLVCRTTPVALITGLKVGVNESRTEAEIRVSMALDSTPACTPARNSSRISASTSRTCAVTYSALDSAHKAAIAGRASNSCTAGMSRRVILLLTSLGRRRRRRSVRAHQQNQRSDKCPDQQRHRNVERSVDFLEV